MATRSVWQVYVRVENNGQFAEYDGPITYTGAGVPPVSEIIAAALRTIVGSRPDMAHGNITASRTSRIS
ncbi:hypothetical protein ACFXAZ_34425 [Streptomyces sp. NPDC059477]|uniref:hypothetical protein n=1 Tax=Streptomyces sp. NPDC059477 TaxID=3346847 RepID=UPI0036ABDFF2